MCVREIVCVCVCVCVCLSFQTEIKKMFCILLTDLVSILLPLSPTPFHCNKHFSKVFFGAMSFCLPVISTTDILPTVKHFYHCHSHIKTYTTCHRRNDIRQDAYRQNDYRQNDMSPFFCKVHPTHCSDNLFYPTLLGSN